MWTVSIDRVWMEVKHHPQPPNTITTASWYPQVHKFYERLRDKNKRENLWTDLSWCLGGTTETFKGNSLKTLRGVSGVHFCINFDLGISSPVSVGVVVHNS